MIKVDFISLYGHSKSLESHDTFMMEKTESFKFESNSLIKNLTSSTWPWCAWSWQQMMLHKWNWLEFLGTSSQLYVQSYHDVPSVKGKKMSASSLET